MCARTSLLKEVRITVFILVPSVSVVSFFDLQFCRIRRATSPVTSPSSPYAAPLSLNRRTISSMVSSPIPASSKRVLSPKFLKNSSVFSMVSDTRTLGTPEVTPQIRSPYCSILSRFLSASVRRVPGNTIARVWPCVMPCSAVSSCPIMWVAQSSDTPIAIKPFKAIVADIINSLIK